MSKKLIALVCIMCFSFALTACSNSVNNEDTQETGTPTVMEQPTETKAPTPEATDTTTPELADTQVNEFEFYIIDYLTESEVVETVYSVSEEGRPCVTVTHADGTTQRHELYEEQGEILWFAVVKGENEGEWGGDYKIPGSEEIEPTPTTETTTPEPVHEHSYTETIIVEGTCTTWGTKRYTCSCGDSYEKEYALDHVSDGNRVVTHEPTCSSEGASGEHCIYCGERMYGRSIPATGEHVPEDYWSCYTPTGDYYLNCSICSHVITHTTTRPEGVEIREYAPIDSNTLQPVN